MSPPPSTGGRTGVYGEPAPIVGNVDNGRSVFSWFDARRIPQGAKKEGKSPS
ncbi:TPA: hypothetical protein ACS78A_003446 [Providencia alcalifaciens]